MPSNHVEVNSDISLNDSTSQTSREKNSKTLEDVMNFQPRHDKKNKGTFDSITTEGFREDGIPVDSKWSWVILFAAIVGRAIIFGITYSMGLFHREFMEEFNYTHSQTALVTATMSALVYLPGPLSSILIKKIGCKYTLILGCILSSIGFLVSSFSPNIYVLGASFGVCGGLGFGIMNIPNALMSVDYFEKYRQFALVMSLSGYGIGTLVFPLICEQLIKRYSWRGAAILLSGVVMNVLVCAVTLFKPSIPPVSREIKKNPATGDFEAPILKTKQTKFKKFIYHYSLDIFTNPHFCAICIMSVCVYAGLNSMYTYLNVYANQQGISDVDFSLILSYIGLATTICRVFLGYFIHYGIRLFGRKYRMDCALVYSTALILAGISSYFGSYLSSYKQLALFASIFGLFTSPNGTLMSPLLIIAVGVEKLTTSYGIQFTFAAIGSLSGGPLAGQLMQTTGSFTSVFCYIGTSILVAGLALVPLCYTEHKIKHLRKRNHKIIC